MQMEFKPGRSINEAIFAIKQMMKKYKVTEKKLKAFNRVPSEVIWWALKRKRVVESEIKKHK